MEDIKTSWGETLPMTIESDDATSATLYIGEVGDAVIAQSASFVEGIADVSVSAEDMEIEPMEYQYQIVVQYDNGDIRKFPDSNCDDCTLPTVTVCATIDMPGGS